MIDAVENWDGTTRLPNLYSKTSKGARNIWMCWVEGAYVCVRWGQDGGALQDARFKCEPKNVGRANATTAEQQAVEEARSKWKKQVKKKYHWDPSHWETNTNLKPMLAKVWADEKHKIVYPATVQPKLDGLRCFAYLKDGEVFLQSRGGDPYVVHHIQQQLKLLLPEGVIFDGELYSHGTSLQTINSWVRRPQEDSTNITYVVYDYVQRSDMDLFWPSRLAALSLKFWEKNVNATHIYQCPHMTVDREEEIKPLHDAYVQHGYEGAIVRSYDMPYRFGYRSSGLLKMKEFQDDEFRIVGYERGKGKFENVPIFHCKTKTGQVFGVTPRGTDQERLRMLNEADTYLNKDLTVRFFNYTPDGIPFHPVGVAIREPGT
jgi:DNA ligase-1